MFVFHARTVITVLENSIVILCHTGWWKELQWCAAAGMRMDGLYSWHGFICRLRRARVLVGAAQRDYAHVSSMSTPGRF